MLEGQRYLSTKIKGFKWNLGYSGNRYQLSNDSNERAADAYLMQDHIHKQFRWFCHTWNHIKPHAYTESELVDDLTRNRHFAQVFIQFIYLQIFPRIISLNYLLKGFFYLPSLYSTDNFWPSIACSVLVDRLSVWFQSNFHYRWSLRGSDPTNLNALTTWLAQWTQTTIGGLGYSGKSTKKYNNQSNNHLVTDLRSPLSSETQYIYTLSNWHDFNWR